MVSSVRFDRLTAKYDARSGRGFPDTVTFSRPSSATDSVGGVTKTLSENSPEDIPCRYRPASGDEIQRSNKVLSKMAYMLFVPGRYEAELIDVDAKCSAVVAARDSGEPSRTFNIQWVGRYEGVEIQLLATLES